MQEVMMFQGHVYSSLVFESDLHLLKGLLQSTAHRYLVVCVFVALTAPFVFSAAHFMSRKRRDALIKLASQLEYGRLEYLNVNRFGLESSKSRGTGDTPLPTHDNDMTSTSIDMIGSKKPSEEGSRRVILPPGATFHSIKRMFPLFPKIVGHQSNSSVCECSISKKHARQSGIDHCGLTTSSTKHTFQPTVIVNENREGGSHISSYKSSLGGDFFFNCAFASVSVSYSPTTSSFLGSPHLPRRDVQVRGASSTDNYYRCRRKQLISRLCDDYSELLAPLAQVILAKQSTNDGDFAHTIASTASTFFILKSARSLCCMAARDATIHVSFFFISLAMGRFVSFNYSECDSPYLPQKTLKDLTFVMALWHPINILRIIRDLAISLLQDPIFKDSSDFASLKPASKELPNSSSALAIDSLLGLYVFVMSADSPTVRCFLPFWLVPIWRQLLFVEWIGRPAAALWLHSQTVTGEKGRGVPSYLLADRVWKGLTPKGYFVCMLLYSLPEVIIHSFGDFNWWGLCKQIYQLHYSKDKYKKVRTYIQKIYFWRPTFANTREDTSYQDSKAYVNLSTNTGKRAQKVESFYKSLWDTTEDITQSLWRCGKNIYNVCPALTGILIDAGLCFIVLSFIPAQTPKASTIPAYSHRPGLHFYALGCLRGIIIASRWAWSTKVE
ncbi:unnamed protein product [Phytomonas sp. EM1]|nr:unnamed protein product [Phytomonas sp. EM1]|eukprot:CCW61820.1 unnamed protein product [Phytomonas sp. isolate EM1]